MENQEKDIKRKKCNRCKEIKDFDKFHVSNFTKDGRVLSCKECMKIYSKDYRNRDGFKEKKKKQDKEYQIKNKEFLKEKRKQYDLKNPNRQRDYNKKNLIKNNLVQKIRYHSDINFKLKKNLITRICLELKTDKLLKSSKLLGCTIEECRKHIENQFLPEMSWSNHGQIWEIDHIIACSNFNLSDINEQKKCFHYTNLQPLFKTTEIAESFGYKDQIGNRNKSNK